jgi:hypothetical protein
VVDGPVDVLGKESAATLDEKGLTVHFVIRSYWHLSLDKHAKRDKPTH